MSFPFPCEHVTFHANYRTNKVEVCLSLLFVVYFVPNVLGLAEDKPTSMKFLRVNFTTDFSIDSCEFFTKGLR